MPPLADLNRQLRDLADMLEAGEPPAPEQLISLDRALTRVSEALSTSPPPQAAPQSNAAVPDTERAEVPELQQRLATLGTALAGTEWGDRFTALAAQLSDSVDTDVAKSDAKAAPDPLAADPAATLADVVRLLLGRPPVEAPSPEAASRQQAIVALLDTLGIDPAASAPTPTSAAPAAAVPDAILRLSTQLSRVGAALAERQPDLAARLDSIATSLVASDAEPDLLTRLTSAATAPDPATLETLVKDLAAPRPPATATAPAPTPNLAATVTLDLPDPLRSAAPPPPVSAPPADPAPRLALTAIDRDSAPADVDRDPPAEPQKAAPPNRAEPATAPPPSPAPPTPTVAAARALPAAYQAPAHPINMGQVAFELVRQVQQGTSRFTIRLDPPELGRVDVKLQVDAGGGVSARLSVDRAETLDLFQRDQRILERALAQAGLDPARTSLEFSLRQNSGNPGGQPQQHQQQQQNGFGPGYATRQEVRRRGAGRGHAGSHPLSRHGQRGRRQSFRLGGPHGGQRRRQFHQHQHRGHAAGHRRQFRHLPAAPHHAAEEPESTRSHGHQCLHPAIGAVLLGRAAAQDQ